MKEAPHSRADSSVIAAAAVVAAVAAVAVAADAGAAASVTIVAEAWTVALPTAARAAARHGLEGGRLSKREKGARDGAPGCVPAADL